MFNTLLSFSLFNYAVKTAEKNTTEKKLIFSVRCRVMSSSLSEKVLGRRIVNYMRNEALVGRISKQKIQVHGLPSFSVSIDLVKIECEMPDKFMKDRGL